MVKCPDDKYPGQMTIIFWRFLKKKPRLCALVMHYPDHVVPSIDQFEDFECEGVDVLVIIRAAREPLPSDLETPCCQVANLDSIIDVLIDVIDCGSLPREDTPGKLRDVLLDADVGHFMDICSENNYGTLPGKSKYLYTGKYRGQMTILFLRFLKRKNPFKNLFLIFYKYLNLRSSEWMSVKLLAHLEELLKSKPTCWCS